MIRQHLQQTLSRGYGGGVDDQQDEARLISAALRLVNARRPRQDLQCAVCGTLFRGYGGRYCSRRCRNRAYVPIRREQRHQQREAGAQSARDQRDA
jgi:hypothetical protein